MALVRVSKESGAGAFPQSGKYYSAYNPTASTMNEGIADIADLSSVATFGRYGAIFNCATMSSISMAFDNTAFVVKKYRKIKDGVSIANDDIVLNTAIATNDCDYLIIELYSTAGTTAGITFTIT